MLRQAQHDIGTRNGRRHGVTLSLSKGDCATISGEVMLRQAQHDKGTKATIYAAENSISEEESQ
jgi:hypothetical protein